jgi:hypothetical protein
MTSKKSKNADERNGGFGFPIHVAQLKPGVDSPESHREVETGKNHRLRPAKHKEIPQGSLADRMRKARKGE